MTLAEEALTNAKKALINAKEAYKQAFRSLVFSAVVLFIALATLGYVIIQRLT